jgi:RNA polymerase sigma factor (sigma-70 family)
VAAELEHAPQLHPTLLWGWLRVPGRMETLSPGAITRVVRTFVHAHERALAGELFVMVLERIEGTNRRWAARVLPNDDSVWQDETMRLREDLRQDLTLHLWEHLALRDGEQWELFFWRALDYAQRHIATAFLRKHGLRTHPDTERSTRDLSRLIVRLSRYDDDEREAVGLDPPDPTDAFAATDFMDLHGLILELPPVERMVIVMRYWQDATESEIADALGGITTRTVRKYLHLARVHLRTKYQEAGEL